MTAQGKICGKTMLTALNGDPLEVSCGKASKHRGQHRAEVSYQWPEGPRHPKGEWFVRVI